MTHRLLLLVVLATGLTVAWSPAAEAGAKPARPATVQLRDGSVVIGRLLGMTGGACEIESASLGRLTVRSTEIESIRFDGAAPAAGGAAAGPAVRTPRPAAAAGTEAPGAVPAVEGEAAAGLGQDGLLSSAQDLIRSMSRDPDMMKAIADLQNDPQILEVLKDPDVAKALENGEFLKLMANPKILSLMANEKVRAISGKVAAPGAAAGAGAPAADGTTPAAAVEAE